MPALAGADILSGVGTMDSGMTATLAGAVLDNEIISLIHHIRRGYEVNEETLAFEVMKKVILTDDIFLGQLHTVQHLRDGTIWFPEINERAMGTDNDTRAGLVTFATEQGHEILKIPEAEALSESVCRDLAEIMEQARSELVTSELIDSV